MPIVCGLLENLKEFLTSTAGLTQLIVLILLSSLNDYIVFNYIIIEWTPVTPSEEIGVLLRTMATLPTFMGVGLFTALALVIQITLGQPNTNMTGTIWVALRMIQVGNVAVTDIFLPKNFISVHTARK
jgi:hypothetical protein